MTMKTVETQSHPRLHTHSEKPWHAHITLDTIALILRRSIFQPFIACLIPICLRAQATPYTDPSMIYTIAWAMLVTGYHILASFNHRLTYGPAREVDLEEEVVLITGGAGGLGGLIAETYGMRGVSVAVLDVRKPEEERLEGVEWYKCDINDKQAVERVRESVEKDLGTPTILINCAASSIYGQPFSELPSTKFLHTINTNFVAAHNVLKTFLPGMLDSERGGTFVTVSSILAHFSPAGLSDYAASKAALSAMHNSLAMELRQAKNANVKAMLVETGQIGTELFAGLETPSKFLAPVLETREVAKEIMSRIDAGEGGVVRLPEYAAWISWYGVLPGSIQRLVRWMSRIDCVVEAANLGVRSNRASSVGKTSNESSEDEAVVVEKDD